jgi:quinol monooxygenase YgiN
VHAPTGGAAHAPTTMIIVSGTLTVDPHGREAYLAGCTSVVAAAREARGCRDFALSPDLLEPARINVYERWNSEEDLHRFRGSGPVGDQREALLEVQVKEWKVLEPTS